MSGPLDFDGLDGLLPPGGHPAASQPPAASPRVPPLPLRVPRAPVITVAQDSAVLSASASAEPIAASPVVLLGAPSPTIEPLVARAAPKAAPEPPKAEAAPAKPAVAPPPAVALPPPAIAAPVAEKPATTLVMQAPPPAPAPTPKTVVMAARPQPQPEPVAVATVVTPPPVVTPAPTFAPPTALAEVPVAAPSSQRAARRPARRTMGFAFAAAAAVLGVFALGSWLSHRSGSAQVASVATATAPAQPTAAQTQAIVAAKPAAPEPVAAAAPTPKVDEPPVAPTAPSAPVPSSKAGASSAPEAKAVASADRRFPGVFGMNATIPSDVEANAVDEIVSSLRACSGTIELVGYTCSLGDATMNTEIGQNRADAVKRILTGRGIPAERIRLRSKGSSEPVATNDSEEGRRQNRRVMVRCVGAVE